MSTYMENKTKIRLFEAFAGYGSQLIAARKLWEDVEHKFSDICKNAIKAHKLLNNSTDDDNLGDITKIETLEDYDIVTYSFPCQDVSSAGNRKGLVNRSGLVWKFLDIIKNTKNKPKVLLMENVTGLLQFPDGFKEIRDRLTCMGYKNTWKVLNSGEFGVAQHRKRVFMVSVLADVPFVFPDHTPIPYKMPDPIWLLPVQPPSVVHPSKYHWVSKFAQNNLCPSGKVGTICKGNRESVVGCNKFLHNGKAYGLLASQACTQMGLTDTQRDILLKNFSPHQVYSLCGNSIVVNVLDYIFSAIKSQYFP